METIRHITPADLHRINLLLARAFTQGRVDEGYRFTEVPQCRIEFLELYLDSCPEASYLYEVDGRILAFGFSHLWGKVGWIGPVAVAPDVQGRGHGREIMELCVEGLKKQGAATIGLETMPRSYRNLGLYGKLGFVPGKLTVDFAKEVFPHAESPAERPRAQARVYKAGEQDFLDEAAAVARAVCGDLDYTGLILGTEKHGYGYSLLLQEGDRRALAVIHTEPYAADEERHVLRVVALAIPPPVNPAFLDAVVATLEDWARKEFLGHINFRVPTTQLAAYRYFLNAGHRIVHSDLRMHLDGYDLRTQPGGWLLDKWE